MQANEEAFEFFERMLFWLDSSQIIKQLMQKWIEDDSENKEEVADNNTETEQDFEEP